MTSHNAARGDTGPPRNHPAVPAAPEKVITGLGAPSLRAEAGMVAGRKGTAVDHPSQRSLALLAAIVASSGDAILSCDEHDRITSWNPAAERLFGFSAAEMLGQLLLSLVPSDLIDDQRQVLAQITATGLPATIETKRRRQDQALIDVELTVSPIFDAGGATNGYATIARDIRERKANEQKLLELERRFHTYFERMPGLTYIYAPDALAPDNGLLHVSQQCELLTGYPADVWRDDDDFISTVVHPDDQDWLRALSQQARAAGGPWHAEYRIITRAGEERWLRDQANLVYDEDGAPLYWLGFMLDISDQKQAEAGTREAVAKLEAANLELERVSTAKSEFVSAISHELRTPLASIQGFSELIATENLSPEETRRFATTINENALRLARMIGNVLDLDRLESGQFELDLDYDTLNHLIEGVLASFLPTLSRHRFVVQLEEDLPLLWCDPDLIVRVITNLVANAVKYSPAGGTVTVATRRRPRGVELTVADLGMGIPKDQREAIFGRYSRIARPEQRGIHGTGLGLPIAKQIVGLHGGEIWVTDNKPTGSIFHVFLPTEPPA